MAERKPAKSEVESLTFEQAVERLEAIVAQIESGRIGLEQSIAEYERGAALVKRCRAILERSEQRVLELTAEGAKESGPPGKAAQRSEISAAQDDEEAPF